MNKIKELMSEAGTEGNPFRLEDAGNGAVRVGIVDEVGEEHVEFLKKVRIYNREECNCESMDVASVTWRAHIAWYFVVLKTLNATIPNPQMQPPSLCCFACCSSRAALSTTLSRRTKRCWGRPKRRI